MEVLIIGAGIGGLTLGLMLQRAGIACRVFEAASELKAVGVGINVLPHASRELCALGLEDALAKVAVTTREFCFYNRFGQYIYSEPAGRFAGYDVPQFSIHRGDLQMVLLDAFIARAGAAKVVLGRRCTRVEYDGGEAIAYFEDSNGRPLAPERGTVGSPARASIRPCANSSIRTKAHRNIPASTCGGASPAGSRSSPAPA
jgi:2-polyprenyl-6-methoxyphenol hydroxylase-like FAD-dependent oxidoreductase